MADKKISALTAATTPLAGTEVLPIVQSGATVKVTVQDLNPQNLKSNATSGVMQVAGPASASTRVMTIPDANFTAARTDAAQSLTGDQTLSTGNLVFGTTLKGLTGAATIICKSSAAGTNWSVYSSSSSTNPAYFVEGFASINGMGTGANAAAAAMYVNRDVGSLRSINAAGSLNASGADYAEYMVKDGDFLIAKGDICGVKANGKLTNVFADAVSFVVKSTNPSYVGGDDWFIEKAPAAPENLSDEATDEEKADYQINLNAWNIDLANWKQRLEDARTPVDRIAFCGQVPVNVQGATPGQFIIPIDDNGAIKGQAISTPTFEQYQSAVGKVIAIDADGRAKIIVKIA